MRFTRCPSRSEGSAGRGVVDLFQAGPTIMLDRVSSATARRGTSRLMLHDQLSGPTTTIDDTKDST